MILATCLHDSIGEIVSYGKNLRAVSWYSFGTLRKLQSAWWSSRTAYTVLARFRRCIGNDSIPSTEEGRFVVHNGTCCDVELFAELSHIDGSAYFSILSKGVKIIALL